MFETPLVTWYPGMRLEDIERDVILTCLRSKRGDKAATAQALGVCKRTIDNKLSQYQKEGRAIEQVGMEQEEGSEPAQSGSPGLHTTGRDRGHESHMEPNDSIPAQQSVPMRKREEVQGVSSSKLAVGAGNPKSSRAK